MNAGIKIAVSFSLLLFTGCYSASLKPDYAGPAERPATINEYYDTSCFYQSVNKEIVREERDFKVERIKIATEHGEIVVDYFKNDKRSDDLVLVFPIMGGKNILANYFAEYFVEDGIDAAVIHRDTAFKNEDNFEKMEKIFRANTIRDRLTIDFFEEEYGKSDFASFGISRGAINAAVLAGVDARVKHNVIAMGGSDIAEIMSRTNERNINKFMKKASKKLGLSKRRLIKMVSDDVKTDPKNLGKYIDARNTLLILAVFDNTVPFHQGLELRKLIGNPRTIFVPATHVSAGAYTQYLPVVPPVRDLCVFPLDYLETESLAFFNDAFERDSFSIKRATYRFLQFPINAFGSLIGEI